MFKDSFDSGAPSRPRTVQPQTAAEQAFWRIVRADTQLAQMASQLQTKGSFSAGQGAAQNQVVFRFNFKGQMRNFSAQISAATNAVQLRNFLKTCVNGVNGKFEEPDIRPYMPRVHRPF